jgi:hypothetical protein
MPHYINLRHLGKRERSPDLLSGKKLRQRDLGVRESG